MRIDLTKQLFHKELKKPVKEFLSPFDFVFTHDCHVEDILSFIQGAKKEKQRDHFFIVDLQGHLEGFVSLTDLTYNHPTTAIEEITNTRVVKVNENDSLEKALKIITDHKILFVPVVDKSNKFVGVLEVIPHTEEKNSKATREDIFQFIGFSIEHGKYYTSFSEFRYRMPWLLFNLFGGIVCAAIGEFFQITLVNFVILALFIPLVLTLSESIGIQSMTFSLRFLHLRKIHWPQVGRRIFVEWKTSILLGVCCAIILSIFYFVINSQIKPIAAICISMVLSMMGSAILGALFPIILHIFSLDPKVAAGPIVLMSADILTFTIYLGISTWILIP